MFECEYQRNDWILLKFQVNCELDYVIGKPCLKATINCHQYEKSEAYRFNWKKLRLEKVLPTKYIRNVFGIHESSKESFFSFDTDEETICNYIFKSLKYLGYEDISFHKCRDKEYVDGVWSNVKDRLSKTILL